MAESLTLRKSLGISIPSPLILTLLFCLPQFNETVFLPALPSLMLEMESPPQWGIGIYFVGLALGIGFWGLISERIGRRPAILAGILLYLCMSFACANASSLTYLFIAHFFQAVGASVGWVVIEAIMVDTLTTGDRHKLFYQMMIGSSAILVTGFLLGGYLSSHFSWYANFLCLTLVGIGLLILTGFFLPETKQDILDQPQEDDAPTIALTAKIILRDKSFLITTLVLGLMFGFYFASLVRISFMFDYLKLTLYGFLLTSFLLIVSLITYKLEFNPLSRYQHHLNFVHAVFIFLCTLWIAVFFFLIGRSQFFTMG